MAGWTLALKLREGDERAPLFVQIADAVVEEIRRGRLSPGARLPGSRTLAEQLGVHRNTVLAAYDELVAQGWAATDPARGTFVASALPLVRPRGWAGVERAGRQQGVAFALPEVEPAPITAHTLPPGTLHMGGGLPDPRLIPGELIARAWRRALRRNAPRLLSYGDPAGYAPLRAQLAAMLAATRGLAIDADQLLVTRGSQMAIALTAQLLLRPGDLVAVESFGYPPAWAALRAAGATLIPFPVDDDGLDTGALARSPVLERLRAIYLTPHHQFPTLATLSAPRRLQLLAVARRYGIAIIEDDYDHEFHYEGRPVLPLASADAFDVIVYAGSLSKVLAPGLRLGWVAAAQPVIQRLTSTRALLDRQGDQVTEAAVAELLEEGELQRHVHRMRRVYKSRRDALLAAFGDQLPGVVSVRPPRGGMALWAALDPRIDAAAWASSALEQGVAFSPGARYAFTGDPVPFARFGYAALDEHELQTAVRRLAALVRPASAA